MRVTRKVTKEVEVTIDALCNKCGESCIPISERKPHGTPVKWNKETGDFDVLTEDQALIEHGPSLYGLIEHTVRGGYSSSNDEKGLNDLEKYTFSLCETCLRALFDSFVIPVSTEEYNFG